MGEKGDYDIIILSAVKPKSFLVISLYYTMFVKLQHIHRKKN